MISLMHEAVLTKSEELEELISAAVDAVVFVSKTVDASKKIIRKVSTRFHFKLYSRSAKEKNQLISLPNRLARPSPSFSFSRSCFSFPLQPARPTAGDDAVIRG